VDVSLQLPAEKLALLRSIFSSTGQGTPDPAFWDNKKPYIYVAKKRLQLHICSNCPQANIWDYLR